VSERWRESGGDDETLQCKEGKKKKKVPYLKVLRQCPFVFLAEEHLR
jgi:hypothetical protein